MKETTVIIGMQPEAIETGTAVLAGVERSKIVEYTSKMLIDKQAYAAMVRKINP